LETFENDSNDSDSIKRLVEICSKLRYLRIPLKTEKLDELILALPDVLQKRGIQKENPFVLSLVGINSVPELEDKVRTHYHFYSIPYFKNILYFYISVERTS